MSDTVNGKRVNWPVLATIGIAFVGWSAVIINWAYRVDARIERLAATVTDRVESATAHVKRLETNDDHLMARLKQIDEMGTRRIPVLEERQQYLSRQLEANHVAVDILNKKIDRINDVLEQVRNELQAQKR